MDMHVNFHQTYLYKMRSLSHLLEKAFDRTLQAEANITLSQFMVLMGVSQRAGYNQRQLAIYLGLSTVAVKRQLDIAKKKGWVVSSAQGSLGRGQSLGLSAEGDAALRAAMGTLEQYVFPIFAAHNQNLNLMQHIDILLEETREALKYRIQTSE